MFGGDAVAWTAPYEPPGPTRVRSPPEHTFAVTPAESGDADEEGDE
jgi:hypothetical protein